MIVHAGIANMWGQLINLLSINPFSAGIYFKRQNLTFKVDPRTDRVKHL